MPITASQGRLQDRRPVSVIDIGSNSIRLVIYEGIARAPTVLFNEKMLAGLGRSIVTTGELDPDGVSRAVEEFRRFRALSEQAGAQSLHVLATAAAREATNGPDFIRRAEDILGTKIRVLSGREEAGYSAFGIISGFHKPNGIVGDLGGGSLELVDLEGETLGEGITLPLGGLRLRQMAGSSLNEAAGIAATELSRAPWLEHGAGRTFYCVGGTWRNLARLHMYTNRYALPVMHHYELDPQADSGFLKRVAAGETGKMRGIQRISKNRRALLPYGATVLLELMRVARPSKIVISATGVREGYLYSLLKEEERRTDPLLSAAEELALLRSRSITHARELAEWTGTAFAALGIEESEDDARYRRAACLLADIGWRAHPEYRGTQSLNIISHGSFSGIDHPGRAFIALANLFRHEGLFDDALSPEMRALAGPHYVERARLLGGLLRVVYLLTASMPGIIPQLKWEKRADGTLALLLPRSHAALMGERPHGRMAHLARVAGRELVLDVAAE
ncbi:Ppx/GppA phosphatase family protein [Chelativorans sp. M5D2P16]|uniref:Ppx/GppA family phosphatase n=1 Tax=Chelativorans sp. M5D2P16 TaxID=3095678 RepID=UPI002ACAA968|nr:Ppx/GppA phosphatase family protein [Chelativorans sp. M5D2P16]MDZ5696865.1 Ppx/GppA phosphatase family protein [Chelativorans sp. M5D2P16]